MIDAAAILMTSGSTIDTSGIVTGLTSGTTAMLNQFLSMLGDVLPVAFPILGISAGLYFCIGLIRRFMA